MPLTRYYILENDTTTAGGIVQTTTNPIVFDVDGKKQSCIGDDVWCPACQSMGQIIPTGPRLSFSLGEAMPALNDDLCLCKCNPPPKLVHSQTSFKEIIDDNKIVEYVEYVSKLKKQISTPIQNNFVPKGAYSADGLQEDLGCYCNKNITWDFLEAILPNDVLRNGLFYKSAYNSIKNMDKDLFLKLLNQYMNQYEINTCLRKAHFLAQISCESDFLRTTEEYKNKDGSIPKHWHNYKGGQYYHGRGIIQLTHDNNYEKFFKYIGKSISHSLVAEVASNPEYLVHSATWYWVQGSSWGNGNQYADKDDLHYITMLINGGFNHYCDRKKNLVKLLALMNVEADCGNIRLINKEVGVYDFGNSALSRSSIGSKIWKSYHNNPKNKKFVECEKL